VDPEQRVALVKLPLNAVTPKNLRAVLNVRGISDWSVERMVEQHITKGHLVVFHLEVHRILFSPFAFATIEICIFVVV
jgi:hypothetical protein